MVYAEIDSGTDLWRPPMLVADAGRVGDDGGCAHRRVVKRPVRAEERAAIGGRESLARQCSAEVGGDAVVVRDHVADAIAARRTPGQVVLSPSKEVARNGSAISDEGSVQKHAVVQRVGDRRQTQLEVTPGLLKTAAQHEIRYQILQRVKKRDAAEAGVR